MTIASFLFRRRRVLAICMASVVLHYLAIGYVGARIGLAPDSAPPPEPVIIGATLHAPTPVAAPVLAAPPAPKPRPAPPRARRIAKSVPVAPPVVDAAPSEAMAAAAENTGEGEPAAVDASAAQVAPAVDVAAQPPVDPAPPEPPPAAPVPPEPAPKPGYKVSPPPSAELTFEAARTDRDGGTWSGVTTMSWKQGGGAYTMRMEASVSVLVASVNLALLTSEGGIDAVAGIVPRSSTEKRRGKAQTATHFGAPPDGRITFSASERSYPMVAGTQDKATFPMQLAAIGRADSAQLAAGIELFVGEDKDANMFSFTLVGQEELETRLGKMATWHLSRPPRPGAYNSRLDVWLAPAHNWYPVQIRNTESNGAVTTQTIRKIVITD